MSFASNALVTRLAFFTNWIVRNWRHLRFSLAPKTRNHWISVEQLHFVRIYRQFNQFAWTNRNNVIRHTHTQYPWTCYRCDNSHSTECSAETRFRLMVREGNCSVTMMLMLLKRWLFSAGKTYSTARRSYRERERVCVWCARVCVCVCVSCMWLGWLSVRIICMVYVFVLWLCCCCCSCCSCCYRYCYVIIVFLFLFYSTSSDGFFLFRRLYLTQSFSA